MSVVTRFFCDESGATAIEYGLIAAILGVGIISSLQSLRNSHAAMMDSVRTNIIN